MLEILVLFVMLAAVVALLERNHQRTVQLSRTPFALDLEVDGSADQRRLLADLRALEQTGADDLVSAPHAAAAASRHQPQGHHARPRMT